MTEHKNIQNTQDNLDLQGDSWVDREFSHPTRTIRLATSFSGIGAIEYAFKRLNLNVEIVFAGDIDANCKRHTSQITKYQKNNGTQIYKI